MEFHEGHRSQGFDELVGQQVFNFLKPLAHGTGVERQAFKGSVKATSDIGQEVPDVGWNRRGRPGGL